MFASERIGNKIGKLRSLARPKAAPVPSSPLTVIQ